ncbi:kinesin-like protein KIF28P [Diadema antillarum]|uniref:kinesin-like protein KIF28P n=1 Tax=Diadema antillarum TaxID=105358 RepID=UPI003A83AF40
MAENVKVAVRVRPFNDREKTRKAKCIIQMNGNTTLISNPENDREEPKKFTYDFSYWSHDGFKENKDGYLEPTDKKYADQKRVFADLGASVLENAWQGYNCCLFAYGQTGSGKSYSIVGYGANRGIVPVACSELFRGIAEKMKVADKSKEEEYQVFVSMLEIYNEQVRDLLTPSSFKVKGGLKIREHAQKGFFVEQQATFPVMSYADINNKINEGTRNRTIASTNMNATSSRAHTIVSIRFVQKGKNETGKNMTKTSVINLVDLAGSERVESSGATGDRLKEGAAINLSLSSLGNVIKALADLGSGKKGVRVPYRNSKLTMLLKNALGGNSKTIMIAAISPADINFDETLSTLRYADRAKSIKTKAVVNESPTDKLIRELKEENARLLKELEGKGGGGGGVKEAAILQGIPEEEVEEMKKQLEQRLHQNQEEMETMKKSWEQKLKEVHAAQEQELRKERNKQEEMKVTPHFWNLNEDPALTGMIVHFVKPGLTKVGSDKASPAADIVLSGLNMEKEHAVISNRANNIILKPCLPAKVLLNGKQLTDRAEVHHNDRVLFGSKHLYVFHHPQDLAKNPQRQKQEEKPTYSKAQEEIAANSGFDMQKGPDKSKDELLIQEDLVELIPHVSEANAMSEELKKRVRFEIALISPTARGAKHGRTEVSICMKNVDNENEFLWSRNKFLNRKYLMQEMYQNFTDGDKYWDVEQDRDPFWEPPDTEVMIGCVHVYLQSLGYLIEIEELLGIGDFRGMEQGLLQVDIRPCNPDGSPLPDEEFVDDPDELLGKPVTFKFTISSARGLPYRIAKSVCRYKFYVNREVVETKLVEGRNPEYNHSKVFAIKTTTKEMLNYLGNESLIIEVWGKQKDPRKGSGSGTPKHRQDINRSTSIPSEEKYKLNVELNTEKKRVQRLEGKLQKIQELVTEATRLKQTTLQVSDVQEVLNTGNLMRFKAAAHVVGLAEQMKKEADGKVMTSAVCILQ